MGNRQTKFQKFKLRVCVNTFSQNTSFCTNSKNCVDNFVKLKKLKFFCTKCFIHDYQKIHLEKGLPRKSSLKYFDNVNENKLFQFQVKLFFFQNIYPPIFLIPMAPCLLLTCFFFNATFFSWNLPAFFFPTESQNQ